MTRWARECGRHDGGSIFDDVRLSSTRFPAEYVAQAPVAVQTVADILVCIRSLGCLRSNSTVLFLLWIKTYRLALHMGIQDLTLHQ